MKKSLFISRLESFARRVGRSTARTPLLLYYVMKGRDTSKKDKAIIATCIAYVILPIDLIPSNKFSIFGWTDEILSIEIVYDRMRKYITPDMYEKAEAQLDKWIPESKLSKNSSQFTNNKGLRNSVIANFQQQVDSIESKWKK